MNRDMDAVVFVPWTIDRVVEAMWIWVWFTVLLLLQSQQIVGRDTLDDVRSTRLFD